MIKDEATGVGVGCFGGGGAAVAEGRPEPGIAEGEALGRAAGGAGVTGGGGLGIAGGTAGGLPGGTTGGRAGGAGVAGCVGLRRGCWRF